MIGLQQMWNYPLAAELIITGDFAFPLMLTFKWMKQLPPLDLNSC